MMAEVPYIETRGSAHQRGEQHGEALRERIRRAVAKWPVPAAGSGPREAIVGRCLRYLRLRFPELLDEMRGIARGGDQSFEAVFWLSAFNALPRVPGWQELADDSATSGRCTGVVLRGQAGVVLGKSSDIDENQREQYLLERAVPQSGPSYLSLRWVGSVWTEAGLNSDGLAVGATSGPTLAIGQRGDGIPQHSVLTPVLARCGNVEEALELLGQTVMTGKGTNLVLADALGGAAVVEKSFDRQGVARMREGEGAVYTTNHCLCPELSGALSFANSENRYARLERRLTLDRYPDALSTLRDVYADHADPGAICQHGQDGLTTLATVIADPDERTLWVNGGPGCARAYRAYTP